MRQLQQVDPKVGVVTVDSQTESLGGTTLPVAKPGSSIGGVPRERCRPGPRTVTDTMLVKESEVGTLVGPPVGRLAAAAATAVVPQQLEAVYFGIVPLLHG